MANWYATHSINAHDQSLVIDEAAGDNVAVVYRGRNDAELIAAAPALLAAAQAILDEGSWHDDGSFVYYPPSADDGGAIDKAFAAVAAAMGAA